MQYQSESLDEDFGDGVVGVPESDLASTPDSLFLPGDLGLEEVALEDFESVTYQPEPLNTIDAG